MSLRGARRVLAMAIAVLLQGCSPPPSPQAAATPSPGRPAVPAEVDAQGKGDHVEMLKALERTLALVESSRSSSWSPLEAERIAQELRTAIGALRSGRPVDRAGLNLLFLPTGALQETAMDNGWGDEYLSLAKVVDEFLAKRRGPG